VMGGPRPLAELRSPSGDGFQSTLGSFRIPALDYELYPIGGAIVVPWMRVNVS
jgi:hypothetical protein